MVLPAAMRAEQASTNIGFIASNERRALTRFKRRGCSSAPHLLEFKQTKQGDDGFVPGGYASFFLVNLVPGVSLEDRFWGLDRTERDNIRAAFEVAYK